MWFLDVFSVAMVRGTPGNLSTSEVGHVPPRLASDLRLGVD